MNYPMFLVSTKKGYKPVDSKMEKGFMFALYYNTSPTLDNNCYDIMMSDGDYANPIEKGPIEKFDTVVEAGEFENKARKMGFELEFSTNGTKLIYHKISSQKAKLPVYVLNEYGFATFVFEEKELLVPNVEDIEIAKKKCKAVRKAMDIAKYVEAIQLKFDEVTNTGYMYVTNESKCYYKYLDENKYVIVFTENFDYIVFDIDKVKKNIKDDGRYIIKASTKQRHKLLTSKIKEVKEILKIENVWIELV